MGNQYSSDDSGSAVSIEERNRDNGGGAHDSTLVAVVPPLKTLPAELLGGIAGYLVRVEINNLSLIDRETHEILEDPLLVTKPWPSKCPFQHKPDRVFFSPNNTCVLFVKEKQQESIFQWRGDGVNHNDDDNDDSGGGAYMQVWHRSKGFLGTIECSTPRLHRCPAPAFSPDDKLLFLETRSFESWEGDRMFQVVHLPTSAQRADFKLDIFSWPIRTTVKSLSFIDNDLLLSDHIAAGCTTFGYANDGGAKIHRIVRQEEGDTVDRVVLVDEETTCDILGVQDCGFGPVAVFSSKGKHLVAVCYPHRDYQCRTGWILIHDIRRHVSATLDIPKVADWDEWPLSRILFSTNGKYLVGHRYSNGLVIFNCNVECIEDIAPCQTLVPKLPGGYYENLSFSPSGRHLIANSSWGCSYSTIRSERLQIIDLETLAVVSGGGWNESSSWRILTGQDDGKQRGWFGMMRGIWHG